MSIDSYSRSIFRLFPYVMGVCALMMASSAVKAENGVLPDKIIFGQTAAIEGPTSGLGLGMRDGILAAFKEKNEQGGVNGRKLELVIRNDSYEPEQSLVNIKKLIEEDKVFAFIGGVGTPTTKAIEPIISKQQIPYIGPFTGAELLRQPFKRYVVNVRASYYEEAEKMAQYFIDEMGYKDIAILYQDDSFGRAGLEGIKRALGRRNMMLSAEATFARNTSAVKQGALIIRKADPEVIVIIAPYEPMAQFVKIYEMLSKKAKFTTLSFVGTESLANALAEKGKGIIVTEVTPDPNDKSLEIVKKYQAALRSYDPDLPYGYVSFEGYISAQLTIHTLEKLGADVTREGFIDSIYKSGTINLDELTMTFGVDDNQGMSKTYMVELLGDGTFKEVHSKGK